MRNKYPGTCYRCGKRVEANQGHFERYNNAWRTQHAECAIKYRGTNQHFNSPEEEKMFAQQKKELDAALRADPKAMAYLAGKGMRL